MIKKMIDKLFKNNTINQEPSTNLDRNDLQEPNCPDVNENNIK